MSITSLITGILAASTTLDGSGWDKNELVGLIFLFVAPSIVLGVLTFTLRKAGKGMAIAGMALGGFTAFYALGVAGQLLNS